MTTKIVVRRANKITNDMSEIAQFQCMGDAWLYGYLMAARTKRLHTVHEVKRGGEKLAYTFTGEVSEEDVIQMMFPADSHSMFRVSA